MTKRLGTAQRYIRGVELRGASPGARGHILDDPAGSRVRIREASLSPRRLTRCTRIHPRRFGPKYTDRAAELSAAIAANGGGITLLHPAPAGGEDEGVPAFREDLVDHGAIAGVTCDASAVIPGADVIVISMNAPAMAAAAEQIAPYLRSQQLVLYLMVRGGYGSGRGPAAAAGVLAAASRRPR